MPFWCDSGSFGPPFGVHGSLADSWVFWVILDALCISRAVLGHPWRSSLSFRPVLVCSLFYWLSSFPICIHICIGLLLGLGGKPTVGASCLGCPLCTLLVSAGLPSVDEAINQSINNQSINQSINQLINQSIKSINQSTQSVSILAQALSAACVQNGLRWYLASRRYIVAPASGGLHVLSLLLHLRLSCTLLPRSGIRQCLTRDRTMGALKLCHVPSAFVGKWTNGKVCDSPGVGRKRSWSWCNLLVRCPRLKKWRCGLMLLMRMNLMIEYLLPWNL